MPKDHIGRVLNRQNLVHLLLGVRVLGTGGGGDPRRGKAQFEADLKHGRRTVLVDIADVSDDALIVSGGFMGPMLMKESWADTIDHWESVYELEQAVHAMERYLGRRVDYLVPFELGGGNTFAVLSCAARMQIPVVDADGVGRAAPETQMSSFSAHGISLVPMTLYDEQGDGIVITGGDIYFPDDVGRFIVTRCGGLVANCHYPMSGTQLREAAVPGTISEAIQLGVQLERASAESARFVETVTETLGAQLHLVGSVNAITKRTEGGFFFSEVRIVGTGVYAGHSMVLRNKNEVMVGWKDTKLISIFPDHLYLMAPETGLGLLTCNLSPGVDVAIFGRPCHHVLQEALDTDTGMRAFSCSRFGISEPYCPTEELLARAATSAEATKEYDEKIED